MSKKYDVVAVTGTYKDSNGNDKRRYLTIGVVLETKSGFQLKLESVPVGWDGWAYLNEPKPRQEQAPARQSAPPAFDDDVNF